MFSLIRLPQLWDIAIGKCALEVHAWVLYSTKTMSLRPFRCIYRYFVVLTRCVQVKASGCSKKEAKRLTQLVRFCFRHILDSAFFLSANSYTLVLCVCMPEHDLDIQA